MTGPRDTESIRRVLEQAAGAAFRRAQAQMENMNIQDAQNVRRLLEHAATEAIARAQEFEIPIGAFHGQAAGAVEEAFMGLWPILKRTLIYWSIGVSLLFSSIGLYGLFYLSIQPTQAACEPLFFDYSGLARHPAPQIDCADQIDSCPAFFPSETLRESPWAAADFFSKHSQWEAYHSDVVPKPLVRSRILHPGKGYFFEVALELPESNLNRGTGMFMVHVHLQSSNGTMLASSLRPARLPHESLWIETIRKSVWLMPMIIGAAHEVRTVVTPSFRHFRESAALPLQYATVSLVVQNKGFPHRMAPLEVTRGEIHIGEELNDFQFLLREYFFTCYAVGVIFLYATQLAGLLLLRTLWIERHRARILRKIRDEQQEDPSETLDLDESQLERDEVGEPEISNSNNEWEDLPQQDTSTGSTISVAQTGNSSSDHQELPDSRTPIPSPTEPNGENCVSDNSPAQQDSPES